jgi:hypothetical protein
MNLLRKSRLTTVVTLALVASMQITDVTSAANNDVIIESQILNTNTVWDKKGANYVISGIVQVPADITLNIGPGVTVDFSSGKIKLNGKLVIGTSVGEKTLIRMPKASNTGFSQEIGILTDDSRSTYIEINNCEIEGGNGNLITLSYSGFEKISDIKILNSVVKNINSILFAPYGSNVILKNNVFFNVGVLFDQSLKFNLDITDNVIYNARNVFLTTTAAYASQITLNKYPTLYRFENNYIENTTNNLSIRFAPSWVPLTFKNNSFVSPGRLTLESTSLDMQSLKLDQNYWVGTSELEIRKLSQIKDGFTDISFSKLIFEPLLTTSPPKPASVSKFESLLKAAADKAAADKAAALNKEINETFIALTNNLNKYKSDISQLFRDYPAYFNQIPELRSSLQRAIDYKIPAAASQSGIDAIRELIGGGSSSALASDFLLAQAGITKYVALENIKAKTAKKTTITCIKGKVTKKVTAVNPKCPAGYKKK